MKSLLLPLLVVFALPNAVNAESYWLILQTGNNYSRTFEKIKMESMDQCEEQGEIFKSYSEGVRNSYGDYVCLTGK